MKSYQVVRTDYPMEVHAVGCKHLSQRQYRGYGMDWTITGETVDAAVAVEVQQMNIEFEREYKSDELFRIMPCAK